ncbi:HlyD family secretion protein [Tateyamaria pelophila]|uniref:HlyD family secretion protein n=1 Tax=Tateyamaria pelophila TaxID=328415 RepID=UPI00295843F9|nr:biotin/lipoyl-binding protein [Tateyamaria pelophila]
MCHADHRLDHDFFYYHPTTSNVSSFFRTVTVLSESGGRVAEVFVRNNEDVQAGEPIFRLDDSSQQAAAETARRQIAEVEASLVLASSERAAANALIEQARAQLTQSTADFDRQNSLLERGSSAVSVRDVEILETQVSANQASVDAAMADLSAVEAKISVQLPAQRASAEAALEQAETEIEKLTIYAGTTGRIEQLSLQVGDIVSPVLRPAGILVPTEVGYGRFLAGFPQVTTQVIQQGGVAEMMCISKPFTIIPMVIVEVQDVIASGQVRPSDLLLDPQNIGTPGTISAYLEPIFPGQADGIPPGSRCIANAYTDNHHRLETDDTLGFFHRIFLHVVDTVGVVHAAGLRIRALLLPLQTLVFTGH